MAYSHQMDIGLYQGRRTMTLNVHRVPEDILSLCQFNTSCIQGLLKIDNDNQNTDNG